MTVQSSSELIERSLVRGMMPRTKPGRSYNYVLRGVALLFTAVLALFVWSVLHQSWPAWSTYGLHIITGNNWAPAANDFGALPLILATLLTAGVALLFAVPIGIGTALTLNFLVPRRLAGPLTTTVELLAAVPSVVYGLWGLNVIVPWMSTTAQPWLASITNGGWPFSGNAIGLGIATASVVLAVMVLPTIVAISRDVIGTVPRDLVEGALSLGATRSQVLTRVVIPNAKVGLLGAVSLGAGRALGETIAVAMVIGSSPSMPHSLFSLGSTLASTIATQYTDAPQMHMAALGALAVILMVMTASVNALARALVNRGTKGAS
jgi:phosphate transport system permease protein